MTGRAVPALPGVLTSAEVAATAAAVARVQQADGAVPFAATDPHVDPWNHVEAAMALLVGGQVAAAERAYEWCLATQRRDGSWPMRTTRGVVDRAGADTNMCAYLAVGVWHHWLVRGDERFLRRLWPVVRRGLDYVADLQLPFGGVAWCQEYDAGRPGAVARDALLAGSSSIHHSLLAGTALADLVGEPQPEWELAAGRLRHALARHRDRFVDKSSFSMDWYYPVLGGALRGVDAVDRLAGRWEEFVVPGLGVRCVSTNPWVTGAETCELAIALDAIGEDERARALVAQAQRLRHDDGSYWTGIVYPDEVFWPVEQTTYTSAAVVLAVDALSRSTPGSGAFRAAAPQEELASLALECGCDSVDARAGVASGAT
jgi:hypothetical protein